MSKPIDGTIFRLPLRTVDIAEKSGISGKTYTSTKIRELLEEFRNQAFRGALLFLKHIEKIEAYKAGDDGQLERLWAVTVDELSEEARRKRMMVEKNQVYSTSFLLNVRISDSRDQAMQKWLVTTALSELPPNSLNLQQFAKRNRLVAHTGVAGLLESSRDADPSSTGALFTFLPLPIGTGLPVHLQGCFALSSDRRSIILPDTTASQEEIRGESWNEFLLGTLLPQRHLEFLQNLAMHKEISLTELAKENKNLMTEEYMAKFIDKYYMYWPSQCDSMLKTYCSRFWDFPPDNHMKIFYTPNGGGKWTSYSRAVFEDIEFSKNPTRRRVIRDLLIKRDYEIVQIPRRFIEQELIPKKSRHITRDLVRKGIQNTTVVDGMQKADIAVLLEYILEVGKFADLRGCTLLPLMNGTLGMLTEGCQYFVAESAEIDLFFHLSARFVDCSYLPESIIHNLCTPEAAQELGVKRFDEETLVQFLSEVLPSGTQLEYDHDGTTIPNDKWLRKLWKYLDAKDTVEVKSIAKFPLLPTVKDGSKPVGELVSLDPQLPRIIHSLIYPEISAILRKTGTFLIDKMYTKRLSNYVLEFTPTNVLKCIQLAGKTKGISVEELMSAFKLTSSECEALRNFVQENGFSLLDSDAKGFSSETSSVLEQLPIWPVHSSTGKTRFKAAKDCYLLPHGLSAFSVPSGSRVAIVSMEPKIDRNFVSKIGTRNLSTEEHFERNVLPSLQKPLPADKIPAYMEFLNQILKQSESRPHLCRLLSQHKILLSDGPTSDLYRPDQLYDHATALFGIVFEGAGKFVAAELRENLAAIRRIGLKSNVDGATFLECVTEIHRLSNLVQPPLGGDILNRAKSVISHLNSNLGIALQLQSNQLDQLVQLPIVPVENTATRLPKFAQLFAHIRSTLGLYPFSAVCAPEHRDIVWTQRPIYDENLFVPSLHVLNNVTTLRKPSVETVLDHLETLALKVSKCCPDEQDEFNRMLEKTYTFLQECVEKKHAVELIKKRLSRSEPLFLNGDDPTDRQNWKPAQCLVHGAANDDIQPPWFKIHKKIEPFYHLLKLGGAISIEKVDTKIVIQNYTQSEVISRNLTDFYNCTNDPAIEGYKDVIFVVKGKKFPAFRLVLAAASDYFRNMFFGQTRESLHAQLPIEVTVDDVTPTSFRIVLDYLHTGRIEVGPGDVADDCGWSEGHAYRYLQVYLDLLQSADKLLLDNMRQMIEKNIVTGDMVGIETVLQVEKCAKKFRAEQLEDYCRRFRLANESLIVPLDSDDE
ncbi:hypothetical protein BC936DRAFT_146694 [Jimgerdemannia flammicorona]|uniref:BTB domain-containing protein n=1 Tax=Jimgerdemannia flammicorona TaxID=994334 RepID=A0A433D715_9FUNG|nr:hypothetical protein BC936DRAFT_146694 [Jimgerdemannia flammicorona]